MLPYLMKLRMCKIRKNFIPTEESKQQSLHVAPKGQAGHGSYEVDLVNVYI